MAQTEGSGSRPRVLVVDDDRMVLRVMVMACQRAGFDVSEASAGNDAVELATRQSFDVLLTDYLMPAMDGAQLAAAVRDLQPDIAVVFITGTTQVESLEVAATSLGASVLHKPVKIKKLVQVVESCWKDS